MSPNDFVTDRTCQFLILHGEDDAVVPYSHSLALDAALSRRGIYHIFYTQESSDLVHSYLSDDASQTVLEFIDD